jgi:hypothetical protein
MSDFTGHKEKGMSLSVLGPEVPGLQLTQFRYTSVAVDVLLKSGTGKAFDTVVNVGEYNNIKTTK